jgi:hypothetical protein
MRGVQTGFGPSSKVRQIVPGTAALHSYSP